MWYLVFSGIAFALGVFAGHRVVEWIEDTVFRFWGD